MKIAAAMVGLLMGGIAQAQMFEVLHSENAERWKAKVVYPQFLTMTAVNGVANPGVKGVADKAFYEFVADAKRLDREGWVGPAWELEMAPTVGVANAGLVSVMWNGVQYTGGANAMSFFVSKTYGPKDGGWKELGVADLLVEGVDATRFVSAAVLSKLNAQKAKRGAEALESLDGDLIENFVVTPAGITWLFSKGDVGAGAEGTYQIKVLWSEMPEGLDRNGPVGGLIGNAENLLPVTGTVTWDSSWLVPDGVMLRMALYESEGGRTVAGKTVPFMGKDQEFSFGFDGRQVKPGTRYWAVTEVLVEGHPLFAGEGWVMPDAEGFVGAVRLEGVDYPEMERPWMLASGTVGYRERIMMPPGSVARFKLVRMDGDRVVEVLQQKTVPFTGTGMKFNVTFDNSQVDAGGRYGIEITLEHSGRVWFGTEKPSLIESYGWETPRSFTLVSRR